MTLKKIKDTTVKFLEILWLPLLLLIVVIFLGLKLLPEEGVPEIFIGVVLGILLGFVVGILNSNYIDFINKIKLEKAALELLKADAIIIYKCFYHYEAALNKQVIDPHASIPPKLGLKNWTLLKQNMQFLLLSTTSPLKEICKKMSSLEDLNETIIRADDKRAYDKDKFSEMMAVGRVMLAVVMFKETLKKKEHENLLSLLMTSEEIKYFKNKLQKMGRAKS